MQKGQPVSVAARVDGQLLQAVVGSVRALQRQLEGCGDGRRAGGRGPDPLRPPRTVRFPGRRLFKPLIAAKMALVGELRRFERKAQERVRGE